jgi:AcrR family transcriptional regulator
MRQDKARRILDAAEALLLRLGYRKVAVADIAARAGVGKGTVYLYWPSKAELFGAVLVRESARQLDGHIKALRTDPAEAHLHRTMRTMFHQVLGSPLATALYTRDQDMLGELLIASPAFLAGKADTTTRYLTILHRHGLLTDDPATDRTLTYRLSAVLAGSFLFEGLPGVAGIDVDTKADALATTVRRAFAPADEPTQRELATAAGELAELFQQWRDELARDLTTV